MEANLAQIIAAQRHSSEGPVPASLLPFAMCSQVSPTLSLKPLADRLDLLTGGRAQVSNQSGDTLPSNFVLVLGLAACIGGDRKGRRNDHFCAHFPVLSIPDGNHNVPEHIPLFVHASWYVAHS